MREPLWTRPYVYLTLTYNFYNKINKISFTKCLSNFKSQKSIQYSKEENIEKIYWVVGGGELPLPLLFIMFQYLTINGWHFKNHGHHLAKGSTFKSHWLQWGRIHALLWLDGVQSPSHWPALIVSCSFKALFEKKVVLVEYIPSCSNIKQICGTQSSKCIKKMLKVWWFYLHERADMQKGVGRSKHKLPVGL